MKLSQASKQPGGIQEAQLIQTPVERKVPLRTQLRLISLAVQANWKLALAGLAAFLSRKRMRGWNLINSAAARHPDYYTSWTTSSEKALIDEWIGSQHGQSGPTALACLIFGEDERLRQETISSLHRTLPNAYVLMDKQDLTTAISEAYSEKAEWILAVSAGTRFSSSLAAVLGRALDRSFSQPPFPILYWDCDNLAGCTRQEPFIKPDWDPVLHSARDMLLDSSLISATSAMSILDIAPKYGFSPAGFDELIHRMLALPSSPSPRHIPLILTHRYATTFEPPRLPQGPAGPSTASYWPKEACSKLPGISIIIPTRDQGAMLQTLIDGLETLEYPGPIELLIVDNDSTEVEARSLLERIDKRASAQVLPFPGPFNFAAMMNAAAAIAGNDYLCLLNNDIETMSPNWLTKMMEAAIDPGSGAIGARLLYPDGTIQHVGVAVGIGDAAGHVQKGVDPEWRLFHNWHDAKRQVSAVTAACLVVQRSKFLEIGGMDAKSFAVDFNDVDLCLRLQQAGFINMVVPSATLIHHESKSRGISRTPPQQAQFEFELQSLRERWGILNTTDPWFSPLFRRQSEQCLLQF